MGVLRRDHRRSDNHRRSRGNDASGRLDAPGAGADDRRAVCGDRGGPATGRLSQGPHTAGGFRLLLPSSHGGIGADLVCESVFEAFATGRCINGLDGDDQGRVVRRSCRTAASDVRRVVRRRTDAVVAGAINASGSIRAGRRRLPGGRRTVEVFAHTFFAHKPGELDLCRSNLRSTSSSPLGRQPTRR